MKYELLYNHPHQLISDHEFQDESGQLLRSRTLKGLVEAVVRFRQINGLPPGDVEQEIAALYAIKYPWMVRESHEPEIVQPGGKDEQREASKQIVAWVSTVWRNPPQKLLEPAAFHDRAEACRECPYNTQFNNRIDGSADLCRRIYILARGDTPAGVDYCSCHKWHAGLAVMIQDSAERTDQLEVPECCWLLREQQDQPAHQ